jgi:hypothetical protein
MVKGFSPSPHLRKEERTMASRTTTAPSRSTAVPAPTTTAVLHERIAQRAYEKWCQRGCPPGSDKQDWYDAEAELQAEQGRGAAVPPRREATR